MPAFLGSPASDDVVRFDLGRLFVHVLIDEKEFFALDAAVFSCKKLISAYMYHSSAAPKKIDLYEIVLATKTQQDLGRWVRGAKINPSGLGSPARRRLSRRTFGTLIHL